MRYTLRNKHKISKSLGNDFLYWLELSIANHFKTNEVISIVPDYVDEPYPIIHVDNVQPHTDSFYELYVISITFDVYLLAYKSCCG